MRKKDLIYFTSAAILIAVSSQSAQADEQTISDQTVVEQHTQVSPEVATSPYLAGPVKVEADATTNLNITSVPKETTENPTGPVEANQTVPSTEEVNKEQSKETVMSSESQASNTQVDSQSVSQEVKKTEAEKGSGAETVEAQNDQTNDDASKEVKASTHGSTSFLNTGTSGPRNASTNVAVQSKTFIDVSSHNGYLSVEDYRILANKGVGGVVVKLTEATTYTNPYAEGQIRNAQSAGLQVSAYAYSHYTNEAEARAEARYFVSVAKRFNLSTNTVMVNDIEEPSMQANINRNTLAWADEMRRQGYTNLMYYTSASWLSGSGSQYKGPINAPQFGVQNFWVAQYPAPKLTTTDAKQLRYNGNTGAWQFTSQADLLSGKHVFDLSVDYTGRFTANAKPAPLPPVKGKISFQNSNPMTGDFDVVISDVSAPYGVKTVLVPVWPDGAKQSEVAWYTANPQSNGTYSLHVKASDHKNKAGKYNVHLYYVQQNDEQIGVGGTTTQVIIGKTAEDVKPKGKITIANSNPATGDFDVIISEVYSPYGVKSVSVPVWPDGAKQSEVIWYTANRQTDGTYSVHVKASDHKNSTGNYNVHLYYVLSDGQQVGVGGTKTKVTNGKEAENLKPSAKLTVKHVASDSYAVIVSDIQSASGVKEVLLPSWSDQNGQDDLKWYKGVKQADGTYLLTVKASDHGNVKGIYHTDIHIVDTQGNRYFLPKSGIKVTLKDSKPSGTISVANQNQDKGTFDVVISDIYSPKGVRTVQVPIWPDGDGLDKVVWYTANRQNNGTYKVSVKASDHDNKTGLYHIHLYYIQNDGSQVGVGGTTTQVAFKELNTQTQAKITNVNSNAGTWTVTVTEAPQGRAIKNIRVAAWYAQNTGTVNWYNTTPTGKRTEVVLSTLNHGNAKGDYTTHVYVDYADGSVQGFNLGNTTLSPQNQRVNPQSSYYSQRDGRWAGKWYPKLFTPNTKTIQNLCKVKDSGWFSIFTH